MAQVYGPTTFITGAYDLALLCIYSEKAFKKKLVREKLTFRAEEGVCIDVCVKKFKLHCISILRVQLRIHENTCYDGLEIDYKKCRGTFIRMDTVEGHV